MAKLSSSFTSVIKLEDDEVEFQFRNPTKKELNDFQSSRYVHKGRKMLDKSYEAREKLFDLLLTGVKNLEDADGNPVTVETKELIYGNWKSSIIINQFEDLEIDLKN